MCRSACPKDDPQYASQETLYNDLGKDLLNHSFEGFNTCIFACASRDSHLMALPGADSRTCIYKTDRPVVVRRGGSCPGLRNFLTLHTGKSYSMMGYGEDRGIIPLICEALFERITEKTTDKLTFTVEVRSAAAPSKALLTTLTARSRTRRSTRKRSATCSTRPTRGTSRSASTPPSDPMSSHSRSSPFKHSPTSNR